MKCAWITQQLMDPSCYYNKSSAIILGQNQNVCFSPESRLTKPSLTPLWCVRFITYLPINSAEKEQSRIIVVIFAASVNAFPSALISIDEKSIVR